MIRRCCCGPTPCENSDCTSVQADCCSTGLRPFKLLINAEMRPTTCSTYSNTVHQCTAPNCTSWGEVDCGGCSPCDPTGSAPGANGRKCPCKDRQCSKPAGRQIPIQSCAKGIPGTLDECRYGHLDYWYMTFDPMGNGPCDVPETPLCPWLGSVTCAYDLVHVPAGYGVSQCGELTASGDLQVDTIYSCTGPGSNPMPVPNCNTPVLYGWPVDCPFVPPEDCQCVCDCTIGTLGAVTLAETVLEGCASTSATAFLTFAAPCGNSPGNILCGYGCDDCASSYIGLVINFTSVTKAVGVYGDQNYIEAEPPYDVVCESLGISNPPSPTPDCDAGGDFLPALCNDKCCECVRGWYVVMRRRRAASDGNLCTMAKGRYEIVGTALCGGGIAHYPCNQTGLEGETPCIDGLDACADPGAWEDYFAKLGLKLIVEIE